MKANLNLLPQAYRQRIMLRTRLVQWAAVWVVLLTAGAAVGWLDYMEYQSVDDELAKFERMYAPAELLKVELEHMRKQLARIDRQEQVAAELDNRRPVLTLLGAISEASRKCNGQLQVKELRLSRAQDGHTLTLRAETLDMLYRGQFIGSLQKSRIFADVRIGEKTKPIRIGDLAGYSFEAICQY